MPVNENSREALRKFYKKLEEDEIRYPAISWIIQSTKEEIMANGHDPIEIDGSIWGMRDGLVLHMVDIARSKGIVVTTVWGGKRIIVGPSSDPSTI